jgi:hypothetical protein
MRVSWAFECSPDYGFRGDRTPEKRKVGGSTPPLTTRTPLTCGNTDSGYGRWLGSSAGPRAVMTGAARRAREREQSAAEAFPLVIGLFRFDPPVERKPPACRTDERPLMCALVGLWGSRTRPRGLNWSFARLARIR